MAVYKGDTLIAEKNPAQVSAAEITAGTETGLRSYSPKDVADMAAAHGGGGIGDLTFFHLASDLRLTTSYQTVGSALTITPLSTDSVIGLLWSVGIESGSRPNYRLRRGATDLTPSVQGAFPVGTPQHTWQRQLFLDKPASTSQQSYSAQAIAPSGTIDVLAGTSLSVYAMPDGVVADVITADETPANNTDFLSVSITPSSTTAIIKLNILVLSNTNWDFTIRRGTTNLQAVENGALESDLARFPGNFEDYYNVPGTTSEVTFHIRNTDGVTRTVQTGSYLMAQEIG